MASFRLPVLLLSCLGALAACGQPDTASLPADGVARPEAPAGGIGDADRGANTAGADAVSGTNVDGAETATRASQATTAADATTVRYSASGNEPFWSVKVDGTALTWTTPEMQPGKTLHAERHANTSAKGASFTGTDGDTEFVLDIRDEPCQDSMSGRMFEFTSSFVYDGREMTGCARSGL